MVMACTLLKGVHTVRENENRKKKCLVSHFVADALFFFRLIKNFVYTKGGLEAVTV